MSPEDRAAWDWFESIGPERRAQVHKWVSQRRHLPDDDPTQYDALIVEVPDAADAR